MKIISSEFVKGAVLPEQFPDLEVSEFAFFGRSNVGKSSLINMLVNKKKLVKTGQRPGMTREVNFFLINKPNGLRFEEVKNLKKGGKNKDIFCLTDLPGYGYAKLSGGMTMQIDRMLYDYCTNRPHLKTIFLLLDMRREPREVEKKTLEFFQDLDIKVVLVGTKADKLKKNDYIKVKKSWEDYFHFNSDLIILSSSTKKKGKAEILSYIENELS